MKVLEIYGDNYAGQSTRSRTACRGIVLHEGKILVTYETVTGQWMIPGGGMEDGEDERTCCVRELGEETGMLIEPSACRLEIDEYYEEWKFVNRYFVCTVIGSTERHLTHREAETGTEPRWMPAEEMLAIFSRHQEYAATDEMRRGLYLREYQALCVLLAKNGSEWTINMNA